MKREEKAKMILEALDEYLQVNWNFEDFYLKAIKKGLEEIEKKEGEQNGRDSLNDG